MTDEWEALPDTAFAWAYQEAERRKAEADEQARILAEAIQAALNEEHVYDPLPYPEAAPHDPRLYEGTGIGALYGVPGCERFLPELGDWRLVPRTTR